MQMLPLVVLLYGSLLFLVYYVIQYYKNVARYPKGPMPLPIVGNFFQLRSKLLHEDIPVLAKKFGNVFTIYVPIPIVVLSDYESVKEAFVTKGDEFAGRPQLNVKDEFQFCENPGVISSNGDSWRENRRQAISILRDFGMGKGLMEEKIKLSVQEFLRCLENIKDKSAVDMRWPLQLMVSNIINEVLFGFRYNYDDCQELIHYVETFNRLITNTSSSLIRFAAIKFPFLKYLPGFKYYIVDRQRPHIFTIQNFIRKNVANALKSYSKDIESDCFVHAYTQKIGSSEYLNDDQLLATCSDFFLAGQETTTTTLRWGVLLLATNQDVQDKLREEILSVIGSSRLPAMVDKPQMPYTTATVLELQRRANILQMNVLHKTLVDTEVAGHKIPKDTFVNGDIHMIMSKDPIFANPEQFLPDRYMNADGKTLNKDAMERTIPFSIGKRQCAGEGMARVELFIGLAALVQHYRIEPADGIPIDLTPETGVIMLPKQQKVRLVPV